MIFLEFAFQSFWHFVGILLLGYMALLPVLLAIQAIRTRRCACAKAKVIDVS